MSSNGPAQIQPISGDAGTPPADLIITGAKIYTLEKDQPWATAMAVQGPHIVFVGTDVGAAAFHGPKTRHVALSGELVLPAFIDSHTHPVTVTQTGPILELPKTRDVAEITFALAQYAKEHPELAMIKGRSWDVETFDTKGPCKELLDAVVADRPVMLLDSSGHSQWLNSRALDLMGVDAATPDPVPNVSVFVRDSNGEPTGWSKEAALSFFLNKLDVPTGLDPDNLLAFLTYLRELGVTSVYDAGIELLDVAIQSEDAFAVLAQMDREGRLPVRYFACNVVHSPGQLPDAVTTFKHLRARYSGERLRFDSVKLFLDGVSEMGTAFLLSPYADRPDSCGQTTISRAELDRLIAELNAAGINFHVHTIGDGAVRMVLDAVEALIEATGPLKMQITMAHVELIDPADMGRFHQLGIFVNHTPHWHGGYFNGQDKTLGRERARTTNQLATLLATGAVVAFSSDITEGPEWETGRANPFLGIQVGHTRKEPGGAQDVAFPPAQEAAGLADMIAGYTLNGAIQLQVDDELGSLKPGKLADFQILDTDLFTAAPSSIHQIRPKAVFMDGELVHGVVEPSDKNQPEIPTERK